MPFVEKQHVVDHLASDATDDALRLAELCRGLRIERPSILVREQRKRWGELRCRRTLRINWRIIQAPVALADYVLMHELAHVEHRNHGPAF